MTGNSRCKGPETEKRPAWLEQDEGKRSQVRKERGCGAGRLGLLGPTENVGLAKILFLKIYYYVFLYILF